MPNTKPFLSFDKNGVCDACRAAEKKHKIIDWDAREKELRRILEKYRSKDGSNYDCIIPVSGGKDSTWQVHTIKNIYGMNPLCVTFAPCQSTELGKRNLQNLKEMGVDHIMVTPNPIVYRKLFYRGLKKTGDSCWPCHVGIFTTPVKVAVNYKVPLIIWGENPQMEYGGPEEAVSSYTLDRKWLETYGGLLGFKLEDMLGDGITMADLKPYLYPSDEELKAVGVTGIFLGYFLKYNARKQVDLVRQLGFCVHENGPERGTYTNYENLDCGFTGVHDFLKYIKYGFGRATDHACTDIRNGVLTRDEAIKLVKEYDGIYVNEECKREFEAFRDFVIPPLTKEQFWEIVDSFRGKGIWEKNERGEWVKKFEVR